MGRAKTHKYTTEQVKFLSENIKDRSYKELWELFNAHFGLNLTFTQITGSIKRYNLTNGIDAQFQKGAVPHNKDKRYPGNVNKTSFKKGNIPNNLRPVGSERIDVDGYTLVKVAEPSEWKPKHVAEWEKVNGPVPKGHCLIFLDGNKRNTNVENLQMITRAQLARMNQNHLFSSNPEGTKMGVVLADIHTKMGQRRKELKKART